MSTTINNTNNFYAPIGQYNAHVDVINANFDKDSKMQIDNAGETNIVKPKPTPQRKPRTAKQGTKYTQATFVYMHLKQHSNRIAILFKYLQNNANWIAKETSPDDFMAIFEGKQCDCKVKWIGTQAQLYYLIRQIVDRGLVMIPDGVTIWQITESHFIDPNSRHFHDFNKQKVPKRAKPAIEKLVDIIDPSVKEEN